MQIGCEVSWDGDVFPCWRRSAGNAPSPNSDVWGPLPPVMRWYEAKIQPEDISSLYLIGSGDLLETFGSYRLTRIGKEFDGSDKHNHQIRVRSLVGYVRSAGFLERPILVSESSNGPFVIIDGNHRSLAYYACDRLPGLDVYLGMSANLLSMYRWARYALQR